MEAATSTLLVRQALAPAAPARAAGDSTLVDRARDGDPDAFEAVYARYFAEILWFCRRKLRSREDAEDAAQNTFVTAYRELLQSEGPIELRPWLYGIARNRCLTVLRARRAEVGPLHDDGRIGEDAADAVVRRQDLRELFLDLGQLPDRQRSALLLSEVGGLSHAQIASTLACRPSQVKALVFQARSSLTDSRAARGVACAEIRQEIASARGAALLRRRLRRHISSCPGCRHYEVAVKRERSAAAFGLWLFPGLGSGMLAALGGAVRLRLARSLAGAPFGSSLANGGWRWAAALATAAATAGGGLAAVEISRHPAAAPAQRLAAALAPVQVGGAGALPRLTAAPGWVEPPAAAAGRRGARQVSGVRVRLLGGPGAMSRYERQGVGGPVGSGSQALPARLVPTAPGGAAGATASPADHPGHHGSAWQRDRTPPGSPPGRSGSPRQANRDHGGGVPGYGGGNPGGEGPQRQAGSPSDPGSGHGGGGLQGAGEGHGDAPPSRRANH